MSSEIPVEPSATSEADPAVDPRWRRAQQRLRDERHVWLASSRADGTPHVAPVWGIWHDGALVIFLEEGTLKHRNVARNPRVAVHLESGSDVLILEGELQPVAVTDDRVRQAATAAFAAKYHAPDDVSAHPSTQASYFALRPRKALAWRQDEGYQIHRWRF